MDNRHDTDECPCFKGSDDNPQHLNKNSYSYYEYIGRRKRETNQSNCNCLWKLLMCSERDKMGFLTATLSPFKVPS